MVSAESALRFAGDYRFGTHYWVKNDFCSIQNGNCLKQPENYEDRNHSEMSLSLNPVGGLRVLKALLARKDCPCEYRKYLLHPFLEQGQWHFCSEPSR